MVPRLAHPWAWASGLGGSLGRLASERFLDRGVRATPRQSLGRVLRPHQKPGGTEPWACQSLQ